MYIDAYLDKVIPYLRILIDEKKTTEKKIQLNVGINLIDTASNSNKQFTFYVKTENVIFLPSDKAEDILDMLIASFYDLYRDKVRQCGAGSGYAYESVKGLCIHFHKIDLNRGSSHIRSPNWLKKKNATINPKDTNDPYCFIYSIVIALNHQELVTNPERISSRLSSHIKEYNWDHIDFPAASPDYQKFERHNEDIALNVLYIPYSTEIIRPEYISEHNFTRSNQVTF